MSSNYTTISVGSKSKVSGNPTDRSSGMPSRQMGVAVPTISVGEGRSIHRCNRRCRFRDRADSGEPRLICGKSAQSGGWAV